VSVGAMVAVQRSCWVSGTVQCGQDPIPRHAILIWCFRNVREAKYPVSTRPRALQFIQNIWNAPTGYRSRPAMSKSDGAYHISSVRFRTVYEREAVYERSRVRCVRTGDGVGWMDLLLGDESSASDL
jgi:hypothetical protein